MFGNHAAAAAPGAETEVQTQSGETQEEDTQAESGDGGEDAPASTIDHVNEAWDKVWSGQVADLVEIRDTAEELSSNFSALTKSLTAHMRPFEEAGRRLLVFAQTFKGNPNAMEAVSRRITAILSDLQQVLDPVTFSRSEAQGLLERVNFLSSSLPDDRDKSKFSPEMQNYINDIVKARIRLTGVIAQYDSLLPSMTLITQLENAHNKIETELPALWKDYYLQRPLAWFNPATWSNFGKDIEFSLRIMTLRLPVELPTSVSEWQVAIMRFFSGLLFAVVVTLLIRRQWYHRLDYAAYRHLFNISIPWIIVGLSLMGSAYTTSGEFFRTILTTGSFCLLAGQIFLAWDLRMLQYPDTPYFRAPFLHFLPLAIGGDILLYLPLTDPLCLVIWLCLLILNILQLRHRKKVDFGPMQLEAGVMEFYGPLLWLCLFIAFIGFYIYSIGIYLAFVSMAIAFEIIFGGIAITNRINEHMPTEGARGVLARLLVALASPFIIVLAVVGICFWVVILPGGTYLLGEYAFKGINIGSTQFNIVKVLLILSGFYITRTIVSMGTRFLKKLPQQGYKFDSTLITPMVTTLTYAAWAIFGLFVLRSLGMELSNLAMVAGGLSVGIGFGMQNIVNNFISGLILIFGRTLQVGDIVEVGGTTGHVRKISVRATMVETYDNAIIYVPNSEFMSGRLINWTSFSRSVRREVQVGVAYGSDTEKVIKLLINIANANQNVLKYPVPSVIFADFAASSLDLRLRFWVSDYDAGTSTASQIRLAIDQTFAKENIEIAFPQLDVHLKDGQPDTGSPETAQASEKKPVQPHQGPPVKKEMPTAETDISSKDKADVKDESLENQTS